MVFGKGSGFWSPGNVLNFKVLGWISFVDILTLPSVLILSRALLVQFIADQEIDFVHPRTVAVP